FASGAHDALTAFTISGWYKSDTVLGNNARLANGAISIFSDSSSSNRGLTLSLSNVGSATALHTDTGNVYAQVNTWTFFAISFEAGSENNVKFYAGTTAADVSLVATLSIDNPSAVIAASSLNI